MAIPEFQCLLGLCCNDFVMIAADQNNANQILLMNKDADKIYELSDSLMMGVIGDTGDTAQFAQFIAKNIQLYKLKNGYPLDVVASVHFTRKNLADAVRTSTPYIVNLLLGGYEEGVGGQLFYADYIGSCVKVPFAAHGFAGLFAISILGVAYNPSMSEQDAYDVMKKCVKVIHDRLFLNLPNFLVKVVSKTGVKTWPVISSASFFKGG